MAKTGVSSFEIDIKGVEELRSKMKALGSIKGSAAVRAALRQSLAPAKASATAKAKAFDDPATDEKVWANITVRNGGKRRENREDGLVVRLGVAGGAAQYANTKENVRKRRVGKVYETGGSTWYWRLLEFGTEKMPAQPFLQPSVRGNEEKIIGSFSLNLDRLLDRAIARNAKAASIKKALK